MFWKRPRYLLLVCAGLDVVGLTLLLILQLALRQLQLAGQFGLLVWIVVGYLGLGWLFGTYSLLGWRRLPMATLLLRQVVVVLAMLILVAVCGWILQPPEAFWLVWRTSQLQLLLPLSAWSIGVRLLLRAGVLLPQEPRLLLLAPEEEALLLLAEWQRSPARLSPLWLPPPQALLETGPLVVAVSPVFEQQPKAPEWLAELGRRDPRQVVLTTPLALAERQLERLPPVLLPEIWLSYDAIPWNNLFGLQRQLKRGADLVLALLLLLITGPFLLVAGLLIWLEDGGPVFYRQERSGWLGQTFRILKLRTMAVESVHAPASWTVPGDQRITLVGNWLRRSRLDELPQLLNVLTGEMSLIGPRPERPELERQLEASIGHYRKRHWMRPGLSGWAQVSAPYAASVEDSELKLSYDLFYLKNFSIWLDLVILLRTLKTVLKVAGR